MEMYSAAPTISAGEALRLIAEDAVLVDVREQDEWEAGHAPQAVHRALSALPSSESIDHQGRAVLVICRSGQRSKPAALYLIAQGCDAYSVDGGMQQWQALGGAVVRSDGDSGIVI